VSRKTPDPLLKRALRVIRKGYGFPSLFNADLGVEEQLRQGKTLEDARAGGCSGCVEVGAFGKEAYILTGYFNLAKVLEIALHDGVDPQSGLRLGPPTGNADALRTFDDLFGAFEVQLCHLVDVKIRGNQIVERKVIDLITSTATFEDTAYQPPKNDTAAISFAIVRAVTTSRAATK
jgi:formate C-acetyltransferase